MKAANLLSGSADLAVNEMIQLIIDNPNQEDYIDHVEGVEVWETVQYKFTCKEFLDLTHDKISYELLGYNFGDECTYQLDTEESFDMLKKTLIEEDNYISGSIVYHYGKVVRKVIQGESKQ